MAEESTFIVHDSSGLSLKKGPPSYGSDKSFTPFEGKVKCFISSSDGKRLAWISNGEVSVVEAPKWNRIGNLKHSRAQDIAFSPQSSYLAIWDIYTKDAPNLSIYDVSARKLLKSFFQQSQTDWKPQWTKDETLLARNVTNEVHFYKADNLQNIENKKVLPKVRSFSLSPSIGTHNAIFFVPSFKGAPAYLQMYKYPNFGESSTPLAQKSFFKVQSVEVNWNPQCNAALIFTTGEADKTGSSYYGEQMIFYLSSSGDSIRITFAKTGSVRSIAWTPSGKEFLAVYGSAPARATLFNRKCDPIAEFGEAARNLVLINPVGNIAMLGALGNISSRFEFWDLNERKQITQKEFPDITHMEWSPCGKFLLTSTCCPRLRVNNAYRTWHYSGTLQHEILYEAPNELYAASWVPKPSLSQPFNVSTTPLKGIQSQVKTASKVRYIPPSQRAAAASPGSMVDTTIKFLSEREKPEDPELAAKKREQQKKWEKKAEKKKKKEEEKGMNNDWRDEKAREELEKQRKEKEEKAQLTGGNKGKRIKNIKKKLESIEALKKEQEGGRTLNANELKKLSTAGPLRSEMQDLQDALDAEREENDSSQKLSEDVQKNLTLS